MEYPIRDDVGIDVQMYGCIGGGFFSVKKGASDVNGM